MTEPAAGNRQHPSVRVGAVHYQILGGAGLGLIFLAQLDQGMLLGNLLVVGVGILGLLTGSRAGPLLLLFVLLMAQAGNHLLLYQSFEFVVRRPFLDVGDLTLAIGVLAYVAGQYRLQGIWRHVLPVDARQRRHAPRRGAAAVPIVQKRGEATLTPHEIARFVLSVPLWALGGQVVWMMLNQSWLPGLFPPRVTQLIVLAWMLAAGGLVTAMLLNTWRHRQRSRAAAQLYLQDVLWAETRREQRSVFRWLAWRKVREIEAPRKD